MMSLTFSVGRLITPGDQANGGVVHKLNDGIGAVCYYMII